MCGCRSCRPSWCRRSASDQRFGLALMSPATRWGGACIAVFAADPLSGAALYADVQRYDSFGSHRYGSPGAERALAWIAGELERTGLNVSSQRFSLPRQYDFKAATLAVDGETRPVMPQWWIPERQATFSLTAPIAASDSGPAPDAFVRSHPALRPRRLSHRRACLGPRRAPSPDSRPRCCSPSIIRAARSSPTTSTRRPSPGRCR